MDLKLFQMQPPPSPSPASAKVSCQRANKLETNTCLMNFYDFYENKCHRCIIKKTMNKLYWVMDGTNIGPYCLPPSPSPASTKSSARGQNNYERKHNFDDFYDLDKKKSEQSLINLVSPIQLIKTV